MLTAMRLLPLALLLFPFVDLFTAFAAVAAWQWAAVAWLGFAVLLGVALLRPCHQFAVHTHFHDGAPLVAAPLLGMTCAQAVIFKFHGGGGACRPN